MQIPEVTALNAERLQKIEIMIRRGRCMTSKEWRYLEQTGNFPREILQADLASRVQQVWLSPAALQCL